MAEKYDARFAGYATRVAFDIRLTRPQIFYLCWAAAYPAATGNSQRDTERFVQFHELERLHIGRGITVPQMRSLIDRGLVEHQDAVKKRACKPGDWFYRLSPAGEHVMALLKIAGLAIAFPAAANEEKPRHRVKARRG